MTELLLVAKPFDAYLAKKEEKGGGAEAEIVFSGLPRPKGRVSKSLDWMDDKALLKQEFVKKNLPIPMGGSAWNYSRALKIFNSINKPIIVKPRAGSRGRHSTTFVYTIEDLKKAFQIAKKLCFWVMVEEQLFGPVYRATVINFELCGVLRGDPPRVVGDGEHNIEELVGINNNQPHEGVKNIVIDDSCEVFLFRQNLSLSSVLEKGRVINLTEKIGVNYGGSSSEDFEICHQDNKELFIRSAKVLGDPIVGFDFIIPDITKSYKVQKCGFIEANSLPFINLHHDPLYGNPRNVAGSVWDMMGW